MEDSPPPLIDQKAFDVDLAPCLPDAREDLLAMVDLLQAGLEEVQASVGDDAALAKAVHRLAGSAAALCGRQLMQAARDIEQALRQGLPELAHRNLPALAPLTAATCSALRERLQA